MHEHIKDFKKNREELNELVIKYAPKSMKRFYNIDAETYKDGALPAGTKELLGLVSSLVLRCDDCVKYHLIKCRELNVKTEELSEALNVGLVVGGSITIPHIRRAFRSWEELLNK